MIKMVKSCRLVNIFQGDLKLDIAMSCSNRKNSMVDTRKKGTNDFVLNILVVFLVIF